jgi:hypothetical protein
VHLAGARAYRVAVLRELDVRLPEKVTSTSQGSPFVPICTPKALGTRTQMCSSRELQRYCASAADPRLDRTCTQRKRTHATAPHKLLRVVDGLLARQMCIAPLAAYLGLRCNMGHAVLERMYTLAWRAVREYRRLSDDVTVHAFHSCHVGLGEESMYAVAKDTFLLGITVIRGLSTAVGLMISIRSMVCVEFASTGYEACASMARGGEVAGACKSLGAAVRAAVQVLNLRDGASVAGLAGLRTRLRRPAGVSAEALSVAIREWHQKVQQQLHRPIAAAFVESLILREEWVMKPGNDGEYVYRVTRVVDGRLHGIRAEVQGDGRVVPRRGRWVLNEQEREIVCGVRGHM